MLMHIAWQFDAPVVQFADNQIRPSEPLLGVPRREVRRCRYPPFGAAEQRAHFREISRSPEPFQYQTPFGAPTLAGRFVRLLCALTEPKPGYTVEFLADFPCQPQRRVNENVVYLAVTIGVLRQPEGMAMALVAQRLAVSAVAGHHARRPRPSFAISRFPAEFGHSRQPHDFRDFHRVLDPWTRASGKHKASNSGIRARLRGSLLAAGGPGRPQLGPGIKDSSCRRRT